MRDTAVSDRDTGVVLGDDWIAPQSEADDELREVRKQRRRFSVNRSPMARKIIIFNILGLILLAGGVLYFNPLREGVVQLRQQSLVNSAQLVANVLAARAQAQPERAALTPQQVADVLAGVPFEDSGSVMVFDASGELLGNRAETEPTGAAGIVPATDRKTFLDDMLSRAWNLVVGLVSRAPSDSPTGMPAQDVARQVLGGVLEGKTELVALNPDGKSGAMLVAAPVVVGGKVIGAVAIETTGAMVEALVGWEREQILRIFLIAILVAIGLSMLLASTIANPLADLAAAAEVGRARNTRKSSGGRVRIPDLSGRPDEIGRLSKALRGMVAALYDRIDANEQFAADVAHELKNPLASLRSAVGTLRVATKPEQREKLLDVIDHDVRRLDRLVTDISNASRLDSELVKEEEEPFDLLKMLRNLSEYLGNEANQKGVEFISDLPPGEIVIHGLEARLAQVFVNLISNAISFCEEGDAIRIWARKRDNRVLVVVEDTGPGIPEEALTKIFNRFYSQRPENQFGNNSGLGLAISKQIVEAHGGVIWAENIRPTKADVTSDPLGARFVVGLPV
ncbi:MAG: HAMP domain-containing protein [Alphaproteobacteria bacterium]|nr:MAG: HAMP domain-containing protein [Alphaproteobacteria bacterium]